MNEAEIDRWIELSIEEVSTQAKFAGIAYQNLDSRPDLDHVEDLALDFRLGDIWIQATT